MTPIYEHDCVHDLVRARARRSPDATAVLSEHGCVTYGELSRDATAIASYLRTLDVGLEDLVGVCAPRGAPLIAAMLGVMQAGAAYVPLDPTWPAERLRHVVEDARPRVVLAAASSAPGVGGGGLRVVLLSAALNASTPPPDRWPHAWPENLALVVYTSGTTGRPKGVALPHRAVVARLRHGYRHRSGDLHKSSPSVVGHLSEIFLPLVSGNPVIVVGNEASTEMAALARAIRHHGTSRAVFVPSQLSALLEAPGAAALDTLDTVIVGGEALPLRLVDACATRLPRASLINAYGTSEVAGFACMGVVDGADPVSAGHAVDCMAVDVLDASFQPVTAGAVGEVCLTGGQLARGYVGRPGLTAERFVPDPLGARGERLYRTGDRGRLHAERGLELLGRTDGEVKVRGFRVNVDEIETAIERHATVAQAVVVLGDEEVAGRRLTAYVRPRNGCALDPAAVRADLRHQLPSYMQPAFVRIVDRFPCLPNGKIDRAALGRATPPRAAAPATALPDMASLWAGVLGIAVPDTDEDFFSLGGDSLIALRLLHRVRTVFGVAVTFAELCEHPTIEAFDRMVGDRRACEPQNAKRAESAAVRGN